METYAKNISAAQQAHHFLSPGMIGGPVARIRLLPLARKALDA